MKDREQVRSHTKQVIHAEIEAWKSAPDTESTWHVKLNNFHTYLPSDFYAKQGGRLKALPVNLAGLMDVPNGENIIDEHQRLLYSALFLSQTPREFFEAIDQAIASTPEVSLEKICQLQREQYEQPIFPLSQNMSLAERQAVQKIIDAKVKVIEQLYEYVLPVYVTLRVHGYSHYDLTG